MFVLTKKILPPLILIFCFGLFLNSVQAGLLSANKTNEIKDNQYAAAVTGGDYSADSSLETSLSSIIRIVLSIIGIIFLILMIVAGYQWMTASGNEDLIKKSKKTIINLLIGLALVLGAYALTYAFSSLLSSSLLK